MAGEVTALNDWETGASPRWNWSEIECATGGPGHQVQILTTGARQGGKYAWVEVTGAEGSQFSTGTSRVLCAYYDNQAVVGQEYFYTASAKWDSTRPPGGDYMIWEVHQGGEFKTADGTRALAPVTFYNRSITRGRTFTMNVASGRVTNNNAAYQNFNIDVGAPLLNTFYDRWVDFIWNIAFRQTGGYIKIWWRIQNANGSFPAWSAGPNFQLLNIGTVQWINADASDIPSHPYYRESGVYRTFQTGTDGRYSDADSQQVSLAAAQAFFDSSGGGGTPAPVSWASASGHGTYMDALHSLIPARGAVITPSSVSVSGNVVILGLAAADQIYSTDVVTISYTQPGTTAQRIQDSTGNAAASYTDQPIGNATAPGAIRIGKDITGSDTLGALQNYKRTSSFFFPNPVTISGFYADIYGITGSPSDQAPVKMLLHSTDASHKPVNLLATSTEVVIPGDKPRDWTYFSLPAPVALQAGWYAMGDYAGTANNVYAVGVDPVTAAEELRVDSYTDGPTAIWGSSEGGGFSGTHDYQLSVYAVVATSTDVDPPTLVSAVVDGNQLTLNYSENLNESVNVIPEAFVVTVAGTDYTPTTVDINQNQVLLLLPVSVTAGQAVLIDYVP